jgi:hypothetical protein
MSQDTLGHNEFKVTYAGNAQTLVSLILQNGETETSVFAAKPFEVVEGDIVQIVNKGNKIYNKRTKVTVWLHN